MTFFYPTVAILAVIAFALSLVVFVLSKRRKRALLEKFASPSVLPFLESNVSRFKIALKAFVLALAFAFIVLALARPQWGYKWEEQKQLGVDIIFAVDTSKSMLAEDVKPNRLERSKLAITDILDRLDGDRVGLVAFSGQAFLQCPITLDYGAFRMSLDALDTNIIQRGGTNIAAAIDESESAFANSKNEKIIILISDGEELEASGVTRAEKIAKDLGVKIYTLGVGGANGEPIPVRGKRGMVDYLRDENGKLVSSRLNETVLRKIAEATGGFYAPLAGNGMDLIYEDGLKKAPKSELSARMKKLAIERFQIPLAIAAILLVFELLVGTRRVFGRSKFSNLAVMTLALALPFAPQNLRAQTQEPKDPRYFFNAGVTAFEAKDYKLAKENFYAAAASSRELTMHEKSYYNIGNVDYQAAKEEFAKIQNAEQIAALQTQALEQSDAILNSSSKVLKTGLETLKTGGEEALKEENLQNQIKQSIQSCEQSKKQLEDNSKTLTEGLNTLKSVGAMTSLAEKNFANAAEISPQMQLAQKNLDAAKSAMEKLSAFSKEFEKLNSGSTEYKKALDKIIEELKKLLRDENKDNQQNQDNQQNKDQQQNQDKQNQNQQDKQDNQQNKDDKQNQDNKDSSKDKENQNQQEHQDKQNEQNKDEQNKQDSAENKDDKGQNPEQNKEQNSQEKESQEKDNSKTDEQAAQNEAMQNQEQKPQSAEESKENAEDKKSDEAAAKAEEQAAKEEAASPATQAEKAAEENPQDSQDFRAAEGVMTRREAGQVLDSAKEGEKKLPFRGYGNQRSRYEDKNYKDW